MLPHEVENYRSKTEREVLSRERDTIMRDLSFKQSVMFAKDPEMM